MRATALLPERWAGPPRTARHRLRWGASTRLPGAARDRRFDGRADLRRRSAAGHHRPDPGSARRHRVSATFFCVGKNASAIRHCCAGSRPRATPSDPQLQPSRPRTHPTGGPGLGLPTGSPCGLGDAGSGGHAVPSAAGLPRSGSGSAAPRAQVVALVMEHRPAGLASRRPRGSDRRGRRPVGAGRSSCCTTGSSSLAPQRAEPGGDDGCATRRSSDPCPRAGLRCAAGPASFRRSAEPSSKGNATSPPGPAGPGYFREA